MRYLVLVVLVNLVAVPALATPPSVGNYTPDDGRFSESHYGGEGQIGNTINAQSWDGSTLGLQWIVQCQSIVSSPTVVEDTRDEDGTGYIKYRTVYGGGTMWLDDNGPWGDGSEDYIADISDAGMVVTSTHLYVLGTRTGVVSDITVQGVFTNYSNCFTYALSNAVILGVGAAAAVVFDAVCWPDSPFPPPPQPARNDPPPTTATPIRAHRCRNSLREIRSFTI